MRPMPFHARPRAAVAAVLVGAAALAGCGEKREPRANVDRPALPVSISVLLTKDAVRMSPRSVGGGPVELIISNRSGKPREIVLETADAPGGEVGEVALRTTPISDGETSQAQALVEPGAYELRAGDGLTASLEVTAARPSAQNELLVP